MRHLSSKCHAAEIQIVGWLVVFFLLTAVAASAVADPIVRPFEKPSCQVQFNAVDKWVQATLRREQISPAHLCSDAVFLRRVYLDVIGTLPTMTETRAFLKDRSPHKRADLVDALLTRPEYVDYLTMRWCDTLRVKAEFPINLWPNAVQAYHKWIHDALAGEMPYDQFARELLTSSGSNFRIPQVNFYRAVQQKDPASLASAVALTFMGMQTGHWQPSRLEGMAAFFSRVQYKQTAEWKEEIVATLPVVANPTHARFPDGRNVTIPTDRDPREVFADWLIRPENPWFTRNIVNRLWAHLFGRGIIDPPDDIRSDNSPSNEALLGYLERELVRAKYNVKHLYRIILNSYTYQQSSIPKQSPPDAERLFACYPLRRLDAEVLIDALCLVTATHENYSSLIPEPYSFIPTEHRTIQLADGSITSSFLEMFGRPPRDTGLVSERNNQPTDAQRLHLLNSTHIQKKIRDSFRLRQLFKATARDPGRLINSLYLTILSRYPTALETETIKSYLSPPRRGKQVVSKTEVEDLVWALINSKEFLYRH